MYLFPWAAPYRKRFRASYNMHCETEIQQLGFSCSSLLPFMKGQLVWSLFILKKNVHFLSLRNIDDDVLFLWYYPFFFFSICRRPKKPITPATSALNLSLKPQWKPTWRHTGRRSRERWGHCCNRKKRGFNCPGRGRSSPFLLLPCKKLTVVTSFFGLFTQTQIYSTHSLILHDSYIHT